MKKRSKKADATPPDSYEILRPYMTTHHVEQVLDTHPPVFMAINKKAVEETIRDFTFDEEKRKAKVEERLSYVRQRSIESIRSAWSQISGQMQREILACWRVNWNCGSDFTDRLREQPVAIIEVVPQTVGTGTSTKETDAIIEVNDPFTKESEDDDDITGILIATLEGFTELLHSQHPGHRFWNEYTLADGDYEYFELLEDFPLHLVARKSLVEEYKQLANKVKRAFRAAMSSFEPRHQSEVYAVFSSIWVHGNWGKQDPNPHGRIVLSAGPRPIEERWLWLPYPRVLEIAEEEAVELPEHKLVELLTWGLQECIWFPHQFAEPRPLLTGAALKLAQGKG